MKTDSIFSAGKFAGAAISSLFITISATVWILVAMIILDFISGFAAGYVQKKIDSSVARRGAVTKTMILLLVAAAELVQRLGTGVVNLPIDVATAIAGFFVVTEMVSVVENCAVCGVPIPMFLVDALLKMRQTKASPESLKALAATQGSSSDGQR